MPSASLPRDRIGAPIPVMGFHKSSAVSIGVGSAATSADFDVGTQVITLFATVACWCALGASPTAVKPTVPFVDDDNFYIPANVPVDIAIDASSQKRIAAIQDSTTGTLHIWQRK